MLSWQFADGRRCADAGIANVIILERETVLGNFACTEAQVTIENAPRSGTIVARAVSPQGGELYRGELTLDPALQPATVTLHPTFSR